MRLMAAILLGLVLSASQVCRAEVLVNEDFNNWDRAPGPGWNAVTGAGGEMSLVADGAGGKALRTAAPLGKACYVSHSLGSERRELYISLRVKVESATTGATLEKSAPAAGALFLTGRVGGSQQTRASIEMQIATHDALLHTPTGRLGVHKTGITWSRGETLDIGLGVKFDKNGFVKIYYSGVKIYEVHYNTLEAGKPEAAEFIRLGPQDNAACAVVFDNVKVATTEDEAGVLADIRLSPVPLRIDVDDNKILRRTNFDCFGVNAVLTDNVPYKNLKFATLPLGITSARWMLGQRVDWDEYGHYAVPPPFFYKENDGTSGYEKDGRSFEEHLSYFGENPQVVCTTDIGNADPAGKKLDGPDGWVQYNKKRGHRGCIYEIGNEVDIPQRPESSYVFTGSKWEQICDGVIRWVPISEAVPQSLMHPGGAYDYTFPLNNKGSVIYLGSRHRWEACDINLAEVGKGDARLNWAVWTDKGWEPVFQGGPASAKPFLWTRYGRTDDLHDVRNLTKSGVVYWSDATYAPDGLFERWKPASMGELSAGACAGDERLYFVKVWPSGGAYSVEPKESTIGFNIAPREYAAVVRTLAGVIRKNGGSAFTSSGNMENPGWTECFESVAPFVDGLAFHGYVSGTPTWDPERAGLHYIPFQAMLYDQEYLRKMPGESRARKPLAAKKLAMTEWGSPEIGYIGGLSTAIALCEILKGGWDSAQRYYWADTSLTSKNPHGLLKALKGDPATEWVERPSASVFKFVRHAAKSDLIQAECKYTGSKTERSYPGVYACGFKGASDTEKSLVLVNRTDVEMTDTPIRWKGAAGLQFRVLTLSSAAGIRGNNEGPEQHVTMDTKPAVTLSESGEARLTLSPYSLYILEAITAD
ncbi:MAG: hypothetical protein Q7T82_07265 [Armatimonadota bacterium]|nr:hypothetical protein [Armatimonadota bacterium]